MKRKAFFLLLLMLFPMLLFAERPGRGQRSNADWTDVHGAGAQRSDPKAGDARDYADGHGPQGDAVRIDNMVRPVRSVSSRDAAYPVVDTDQSTRYNNTSAISNRNSFRGQDADYEILPPSYTDNGDGTVTDNNTGLMWQKNPGEKMTWDEAFDAVETANLGGYSDWRIPSIKELYSLIQFSGKDIAPGADRGNYPFIETEYFNFSYGDVSKGERAIDSQFMSSTQYVSTTMNGNETVFGVNFADGRIKGYPSTSHGREEKTFFVLFVRGNESYGGNDFIENGDGTVTDRATGLMWLQDDAGPMNWQEALEYCEKLSYAGYEDWRLPNAKELQSIVDYSRSPDTTDSPALASIFNATEITNEGGETDYGFYWTSTTHAREAQRDEGNSAAYLSFGRALGNMSNLDHFGQNQNGGGRRGGPDQRNNQRPPR